MAAAVLAAGISGCSHNFDFLGSAESDHDGATEDTASPADANAGDERGTSKDASQDGYVDASAEVTDETDALPDAITSFHRLAVGGGFVCAINPHDGLVNCFGDNESYQLGIGTRSSRSQTSLSWTQVIDGTDMKSGTMPFANAVSLSAGSRHACALRANDVFCWGQGDQGETGGTMETTARRVVSTSAYGLGPATQLASGASHVCVVLERGVVCWGANQDWQITSGLDGPSVLPVLLPIQRLKRVALGGEYSLAVLDDNSVLCWGNNDFHQCGSDPDVACAVNADGISCVFTPRPIAGLSQIVTLAAGSEHACAVTENGDVRCWGASESSEAGSVDCSTPATCLVDVSSYVIGNVQGAVQLALGSRQSCALMPQREVYCWGLSALLGQNSMDATPQYKPSPVLLEGETTNLSNVVEIAAGDDLTCALNGDGDVYCWGIIPGQSLYGARRIPW